MKCFWGVCLKCDSVSGVVGVWRDVPGNTGVTARQFLRYERRWFGGVARYDEG